MLAPMELGKLYLPDPSVWFWEHKNAHMHIMDKSLVHITQPIILIEKQTRQSLVTASSGRNGWFVCKFLWGEKYMCPSIISIMKLDDMFTEA